MAENSKIEWTDTTWNPVVGCTMVSAGCANCYAETMSKRLAAMTVADKAAGKNPGRKSHYLNVINESGRWNGRVELVPEALGDPLKWKKPRRVFVNSMSDLFHEDVPFDFVDQVFAVMALCPQHTFQILTKRPERMAEYFNAEIPLSTRQNNVAGMHPRHIDGKPFTWGEPSPTGRLRLGGTPDPYIRRPFPAWPLQNVWLGTSCEDQKAADARIPHLLKCPAAVRFLSCEPLLGPIRIDEILVPFGDEEGEMAVICPLTGEWVPPEPSPVGGGVLHWVIVGGESGPGARPMHPDWARSLRDQCQAAGVAFFFKQWGEWWPFSQDAYKPRPEWKGAYQAYIYDGPPSPDVTSESIYRLGKHAAGRLLDGREWNEIPQPQSLTGVTR